MPEWAEVIRENLWQLSSRFANPFCLLPKFPKFEKIWLMRLNSQKQTVILSLLSIFLSLLLVIILDFFPQKQKQIGQGFDEAVERIKKEDGRFKDGQTYAVFNNQLVKNVPTRPDELLAQRPDVLGLAKGEYKWIEIDLSDQTLYAHEDGEVVYKFLVSTGKWAPTPTGVFRIWSKLRYCLMAGGSKHNNTYYYLPNVPYTMFFYKDYGIHGTYWHNNFGHPMSHGCVNLATPDAKTLFYWAHPVINENSWLAYPTKDDPGTAVVIHE